MHCPEFKLAAVVGFKRHLLALLMRVRILRNTGLTCTGDRPWLGEEAEREKNPRICGATINHYPKKGHLMYISHMFVVQSICLNGRNRLTEG